MKLKKALAAGLSTVVLISSCLSVSAAPKKAANLTSKEINLILNVEAYKQAYPDLAAAFGNNTKAYVDHYLTMGVYEGRTKGVLFDPLTYAEAYGDIRSAFGYDVAALVNHYVTYGAAEKRIMGTTHGYADIATAESSGMQSYFIPRALASEYKNISADALGGNNLAVTGNYYRTTEILHDDGTPWRVEYYDKNNNFIGWSDGTGTASSGNNLTNRWNNYHHATSVYDDDNKTLIRVEYYDENGKMQNYSSVTWDSSTNSYTEHIYSYDWDAGKATLEQTDTYGANEVLK